MDRQMIQHAMGEWLEKVGHTATIAAVAVADHLDLFSMITEPSSAEALARHLGWSERHLEELLFALTAGGIVHHENGMFSLPEQNAALLADPSSPYFLAGQARVLADMMSRSGEVAEAIKSGQGLDPSAYPSETVRALERMNGPSQSVLLPKKWIAALPDVVDRLEAGGTAADVGCGAGVSTEALAKRFPAATIIGFDMSPLAIARARERTNQDGLENLAFEQRSLHDLPNNAFDFVLAFDVIHDLRDPAAGLASIRRSLVPTGVVLMVEPNAADSVDDNMGPMGALLYGMSALHCVPVGLQDDGEGVGACWGPGRAKRYAGEAGYSGFSRLPIENLASAFYRLDP